MGFLVRSILIFRVSKSFVKDKILAYEIKDHALSMQLQLLNASNN